MMRWNRSTRLGTLRPIVWMAVFALLVRSVVGSGVMPDPKAGANGVFALVICTGGGWKALPGDPVDEAPRPHDGLCPFSAFTHLATATHSPPLARPAFEPVFSAAASAGLPLATSVAVRWARAPPSIG